MNYQGIFATTAEYYSRFRPAYPGEVFRLLSTAFSLGRDTPVLDLGCGTGLLAIPLARRGIPVYAVDPDPGMLAKGLRLAGEDGVSGIVWLPGDDRSIACLPLPGLRLCLMGNSLHWMHREKVLADLETMICSEGGVAVIDRSTGIWSEETGWKREVREVIGEFLGTRRRCGSGFFPAVSGSHLDLLQRSAFNQVTIVRIPVREELSVDQVIGLQLSTSYASPALLGADLEKFRETLAERLLACEPSGIFIDEEEIVLHLAGREGSPILGVSSVPSGDDG